MVLQTAGAEAYRGDKLLSTVQPELRDNLTSQSEEMKNKMTQWWSKLDTLSLALTPRTQGH